MNRVIVIVACGVALSGCASGTPSFDFLPKFEAAPVTVQLESEPAGAEARTSTGQSCKTPCAIALPADQEFTVTYSLAGYEPQTVPVTLGVSETAALGGQKTLIPNPVYAELAPAKAAPKRAPARKPATARAAAPKPAAAAPKPAAAPRSTAAPKPAAATPAATSRPAAAPVAPWPGQ